MFKHNFPDVEPTAQSQAVIDAILLRGGVVIDDHHLRLQTMQLGGFGIMSDRHGVQCVVALFTKDVGGYYSINRMDVVDGVAHITRDSRGTMAVVTDNIHSDVRTYHNSFNWEKIEETPPLRPGVITNVQQGFPIGHIQQPDSEIRIALTPYLVAEAEKPVRILLESIPAVCGAMLTLCFCRQGEVQLRLIGHQPGKYLNELKTVMRDIPVYVKHLHV